MDPSLSEASCQQIGLCHQEPVRVPSHTQTAYVMVEESRHTADPVIWLCFIGAECTLIYNWAVLPYFERRLSRATQDIWIPSPIWPDQEGVIEITVDSYTSIRLTGLQYVDDWLQTYLVYNCAYLKMPWRFDIDNI